MSGNPKSLRNLANRNASIGKIPRIEIELGKIKTLEASLNELKTQFNNTVTPNETSGLFRYNAQILTQDETTPPDYNGFAVGPIEIAAGVTLTISDGTTLVIE